MYVGTIFKIFEKLKNYVNFAFKEEAIWIRKKCSIMHRA